MAMQGSCNDFSPNWTQMNIVSVIRGFKNTIDKKTTSKLAEAGECELVSFFLHDTIEGTKGLLGGGVVANTGNKTRENIPASRTLSTLTMFDFFTTVLDFDQLYWTLTNCIRLCPYMLDFDQLIQTLTN